MLYVNLFQAVTAFPQGAASPTSGVNPGTAILFVLLYLCIIAVVFFVAWKFLQRKIQGSYSLPPALRMEVLAITLPRGSKEDMDRQEALNVVQEKIALAESFYSVLGGLKAQRGPKTWLYGRQDHFSFEMVAQKGLLYFYVAVPVYLRRLLEEQIHAQYPDAHIQEIEDYNVFTPKGSSIGTTLTLERHGSFPIKTYKELDSDPMNSLTNSLAKVKDGDAAVIQWVVRSAPRSWRATGVRIAQEIQQGKKPAEVINNNLITKIFFAPFKLLQVIFQSTKNQNGAVEEKYQLSPMESEMVKHLENKASKAGFEVNVRIIVSSNNQQIAQGYMNDIVNSFSQYSIYQYGNRFKRTTPFSKQRLFDDFIYRRFNATKKMILNTEEFASVFHFPLPNTETPNIVWLAARKAAPPTDMPKEGMLLGRTQFRGESIDVRIAKGDRRRHMYVIGRSGVGKSTLMENMAVQDIQNGEGLAIVDPHGDFVENILNHIPKERAEDVILFSPSDIERPIGLNVLEAKTPEEMDFAAQEMVSIFYKLVPNPDMIGPMFEHNMRNAMLTLMANKDHPGTLADIPRIFTDTAFMRHNLQYVTDPMVRAFWEKEMAQTPESQRGEMLGYLISKVGRFIENEMVRNIIGQPHSGFNFRQVMDEQKILLVNLSKGKVGEVNSNLLGLMIVSKLQMAALGRASMAEAERKDFYLYIDEFQNFVTDSIATILSEARKYKLNLIIAHQYMSQLVKNGDTSIKDAVLGNAGTITTFRIGVEDAEILAKEFEPVFNQNDLVNIEKYTAYIKLLINNTASRPFNMGTLDPLAEGNAGLAQSIKELSRLKYGRSREEVTKEILERTKLGETETKKPVGAEPSL